ncbi:MAG TPA: tyrosine-type recombinase/integrase [Anaerolineales bacterium]|nr:tyrosine-type recombinase/integrase [Anaerolineales bacterium]
MTFILFAFLRSWLVYILTQHLLIRGHFRASNSPKEPNTASGLPKIRFHDLRHTAASLMLNHGIPVLIVFNRLGHLKPGITIGDYGHLIPNRQVEADQLMDNLMFHK